MVFVELINFMFSVHCFALREVVQNIRAEAIQSDFFTFSLVSIVQKLVLFRQNPSGDMSEADEMIPSLPSDYLNTVAPHPSSTAASASLETYE